MNFYSNGGSSVSPITKKAGAPVYKPDDPNKQDYEFMGWYKDIYLTQKYTFSTMPFNNITLYAKWQKDIKEVNKYTISSYKSYNSYISFKGDIDYFTISERLAGVLKITSNSNVELKVKLNKHPNTNYGETISDVTENGVLEIDVSNMRDPSCTTFCSFPDVTQITIESADKISTTGYTIEFLPKIKLNKLPEEYRNPKYFTNLGTQKTPFRSIDSTNGNRYIT